MGEEQHHSLTAPNLWFMTPFANHIWCLDHLDGLTHLSCISRLTKMSKMTNTFCVPLMFAVESSIRDKVHNSIMLDLSSSVFPENLSV